MAFEEEEQVVEEEEEEEEEANWPSMYDGSVFLVIHYCKQSFSLYVERVGVPLGMPSSATINDLG